MITPGLLLSFKQKFPDSKEFLKLIAIAYVLALPLAYYAGGNGCKILHTE